MLVLAIISGDISAPRAPRREASPATPLAISQRSASPIARHGVCDRMHEHIWRRSIPGKGMSTVRPRERRDRCREFCCGPQDRPRGILGCPFLMAAVLMWWAGGPGHHRSDVQPIKMDRSHERSVRVCPVRRKHILSVAPDMYGRFLSSSRNINKISWGENMRKMIL